MGSGRIVATAIALVTVSCGSPPAGNRSVQAGDSTREAKARPALPACPFREIKFLRGSIEGGRLLVTGRVDLMMAGFRPQLTPRDGGPGVLALDLALVPEANAGVSDELRYVRTG